MKRTFVRTATVVAAIAIGLAIAGAADLLTVFQTGDPIRADEVNDNFTVLAEAIDASHARFGATRDVADGRVQDCVLGDVWLTALTGFAPGVVADGRLLQIASNSALFSLIGTTYGGDGRSTFALPDLRDVAPRSASGAGLTYVICTEGLFPSRF